MLCTVLVAKKTDLEKIHRRVTRKVWSCFVERSKSARLLAVPEGYYIWYLWSCLQYRDEQELIYLLDGLRPTWERVIYTSPTCTVFLKQNAGCFALEGLFVTLKMTSLLFYQLYVLDILIFHHFNNNNTIFCRASIKHFWFW